MILSRRSVDIDDRRRVFLTLTNRRQRLSAVPQGDTKTQTSFLSLLNEPQSFGAFLLLIIYQTLIINYMIFLYSPCDGVYYIFLYLDVKSESAEDASKN